jgi:Na+-transporting NADH:ubiquinone oxidoreductase subunit NqrD
MTSFLVVKLKSYLPDSYIFIKCNADLFGALVALVDQFLLSVFKTISFPDLSLVTSAC